MWPCIVTNIFVIKSTRCTNFTISFLAWNSTTFGQFVCPSSGVYSLYTQRLYISYRLVDSFRAGPGSSILFLLDRCLINTKKLYHISYISFKIVLLSNHTLLGSDCKGVRNITGSHFVKALFSSSVALLIISVVSQQRCPFKVNFSQGNK